MLKSKDIRWIIAWLTAISLAIFLVMLIMVNPVIGVADNGDFLRVLGVTGLAKLHPQDPYAINYFSYAQQNYAYRFSATGGYVSTHLLLVAAAGFIGLIMNPHVFDIRVLGAMYAALFIAAIYLIVRHSPKAGSPWRTGAVAVVVAASLWFVFGDIGYAAYFQSFFGEPFSFVSMLLFVAFTIALASVERPSRRMLVLFALAALAVATSKIQNAPLGIIFALLSIRLWRLRADGKWLRQARLTTAGLLVCSVVMFVAAPDGLRQINLYQSVFYGVLKDSPHVQRDMKELGIPEKYAVLVGTNYYQPGTAIPQNDPVLRKEVLDKLSPGKVAFFYLRHPFRFEQKLEKAADNATFIRPYYLGNYDRSAGKPRGAISRRFSAWSEWKVHHMPHTVDFFATFYAIYYLGLIALWFRAATRRLKLAFELLSAIGLTGAIAFVVPLIGDGEADLGKHLFMFNVCFDMMVISIITGLAYGFAIRKGKAS